jgi:hypothetical protein
MYEKKKILKLFLYLSMGEKRNAYSILVGKTEGKRPPGRPRCGWTILKLI